MYRNILEAAVDPPQWMTPEAVDVCTRLLMRDPTQRLGYRGAGEVRGGIIYMDGIWRGERERWMRVDGCGWDLFAGEVS